MNVLHVITGLGIGGAELSLVQIASGLKQRGLIQSVVSLGRSNELRPALDEKGIAVTELNISNVWSAPLALWRLVQIIRTTQPRVIQGWMYHGDIAAALAHWLARNKVGRRLFWGLRASNMDDGRYGWVIRMASWLSPSPDVIVANSLRGAQEHVRFGYRPRRLEVVANGVDAGRFRPDPRARQAVRAELGISENAFVAILVARVDRMKDHPTFLEAIEQNPNVVGLLVGKDTEGLSLPPNVRALGVRHDVERLYAAADAVVSSSAFGEGFSNAIAEGMSAGLVPIATDVGDSASIVGTTGRVVPPRDCAALASAIAAEAAASVDERAARANAARRRILDQYTVEKAVSAFERLYRAV